MSNDDAIRQPDAIFDLTDEVSPGLNKRAAFDFRYMFAAVRSNLKLIAFIVGATIALSVIATALMRPLYTAGSSIQINNSEGRVLGSATNAQSDTLGDDAENASDTDRFLKTQVDILRSRGLAVRVAQKLKLETSTSFYAAEGTSAPGPGASPAAVHEKVIMLLLKHLTVELPRDSRIASISFESGDPVLSAEIANAYASEFIQSNLQRKFDSSDYARNFVSSQLAEEKQRLEQSEQALNDYARKVGLIHMGSLPTGDDTKGDAAAGGASVTTSSLLQLNQAANDAEAKRIDAEARWHAINSAPLLESAEVISNATIVALLAQRSEVQTALADDRAKHLDNYPSVLAKEAQIDGLNKQIQVAANNIKDAVRADYLAAVNSEKQLDGQVSQLKTASLAEQDRTVEYGLLAREVETNQQVYDGLLQRYKDLNASAGISLSNVSIIDEADVPLAPSSPNLFKNLLIGLIAGIAFAAMTVFIKDQFDDSIRIPEDIEAKLGLPLLGVIPLTGGKATPEESLADPKSPIAEAYNSLRGSLLYSTRDGLPHVLLVTSAQPSEGKTTSTYAAATGFARVGKRVVLIDADMRRPSLHRRIDYDNERGFSTLLTTQDPVESALQPAPEANMWILPSGPIPPSPTELLSSARTEEILRDLAGQFDLVIIDSPPILGLADAPMLSALVDGVIFIVEADRSRHGSLKTALRRLRSVRPIILGAVLTKFDPLRGSGRYSSYYGYEYYQYQYSYAENPR